ncbi:MAG TPA: SAM-dependent methyltransferase [Streptosporangiaceae bacterium]|nr:SAM-dependent methyltransferase [Streptosporangiaceae bacterium]
MPVGIDVTVPSVARMYDYLLGGKDNFAADRQAAAKLLELVPDAQKVARNNRDFMVRVVRFLAEAGVSQFIDLGTGIPTSPNVHEIARKIVPGARVVYVDHDPVVLAHSRALLATDDGVIAVKADFRDSAEVLGDPGVVRLIDFSRPVAVLILSVLHFIADEENPGGIVSGFAERLAPGGHLVISAITSENMDKGIADGASDLYRAARTPAVARSRAQIQEFFTGFELEQPGLVNSVQWRPDPDTDTSLTRVHMLAGVGRKI